ncbi:MULTISPECIES: OsmC domain/YcaO domain-containing protein [unclassified Pseudoalteromonas]|jgi:ribosomal protein S12 methylthiotransferase accessory factor|uniref:OsmC domain/YcaO domain-containing protein n=1 Tax=unclassified Pseudoalteromonas TaxID=194690 RepID=UPI000C5BFB7C|nr:MULTISPECIES: OsmC domain/YcaO domain-containing protein [unclassified Pseudoalteromonas]MBD55641.1 OsmC domain/YcaO domain-containing protein [Pseudoalteromonas sp.]MBU75617.1 OsmC domain/YcaO domain-containing protein [Pseudoalteromonadaceae bacterium]MCF2902958.1 OsmC domain/YcaO domain-containing protein [Pseudoalteromonas sp. OFAV1]TMO44545.1 OsmC domain/YcaO domain-containing protein [Pseudoalteromonas sp. S4389]|tara:strand:+ start:2953 stop:5139 length:2187 start_codon:yes stop_codon:yes gene_type:complete
MEIKVNFLDNLRLEAKFDDFSVIADQPIRYKGDGTAPSPFDYFLASSALCAAYFIKVYCNSRDIPTDGIRVAQNNIVDPEDRYNQIFQIQVELPESLSEKDRTGILRSVERCTVKRVIQTGPEFKIDTVESIEADAQAMLMAKPGDDSNTFILGKDLPLEETIANMTAILEELGMKIEISSWRNIVPNVWSLHIRDAASPMCFTNGKGATKESALCSALGEFIERLNCNFFYNDQFLGEDIANSEFVHYPNEKWFALTDDDSLPEGILDDYTREIYNPDGELCGSHLIDTNSGNKERGICSIPYVRHSDGETVYFPSNLIENLFLSNGMSAGNNFAEAKVQCLSEIFERAVKRQIIEQEIVLPDVPQEVLNKYPGIVAGINGLEEQGFPVVVKDASLGGQFPVMCVTLMNPKTGGVFASFGAHPSFEVALERSLTELLQGRSFEGLNDVPKPTFNSMAVSEPENFVEHFIDSTGVISWRFFSAKHDYEFVEWDFSGSNEEETASLFGILESLGKEAYIAEFSDLGTACRILVPDYSEVYPVEDLIWDNTNKALNFREDILNLHRLSEDQLADLVERLEQSELDNYIDIITLIGIEFDENTVWGQLTILELKLLIYLALGDLEAAMELVEAFLQYNDNTIVERGLFYQAMHATLEVALSDDLEIEDYIHSFTRMFGQETMDAVVGSINGDVMFYGLTETSMKLEGLDRHLRLIESYKKLHTARAKKAGL